MGGALTIDDVIGGRRFTILLGKNGSGKSTLLRQLDARADLVTRYITPERGGMLKYEPGIDNNIYSNPQWLNETRRQNRTENFRQQSAAQFRNLEILFLRELEASDALRHDTTHKFDRILAELNDYLPAIKLTRSDRGFSIHNNAGSKIDEGSISSGEAEFIAQAIEVLVYSRADDPHKILLLDEPDVHLHPDLQTRFVQFIERTAVARDFTVVIATHSTAICAGFSPDADLQIVPVKSRKQTNFESFERSRVADELLPIFGAHPLSRVFNESPVILVEGEDDRRVIEQMVRSSQGRMKRSPCVVGTVNEMAKWEEWLSKFLPSIYDSPRSFSLRDGDSNAGGLMDDLPFVTRARLNCCSMENLLLCDESLAAAGADANRLREALERFQQTFPDHACAPDLRGLLQKFEQRRTIKVKSMRNVFLAALGLSKPWEVHVGQVLANSGSSIANGEHSIRHYLGEKANQVLRG